MKTKLQLTAVALAGIILASCSSSMNMSKSSVSANDDIYYTPTYSSTAQKDPVEVKTVNTSDKTTSPQSFEQLEEKYSKILASDTTSVDTVIYKAESTNPYERIVSDSYRDSYERRLRGLQDPWYGMESFPVYSSDDYRYATAFDPYFYNVVVMGNQVWVEPWYISNMFSWPHTHISFGFGFGLSSYWDWDPWWYSGYSHPYYNYNSWYAWSPYYWNNNYYTNVNYNYGNYYYGRRDGLTTTNSTPRLRRGGTYENQITTSRRRDGFTTRGINTNRTDTRTGNRNKNQEIITRGGRNGDANSTHLRGGTSLTRNTNMTEPTRRNNNGTYQRPRSTNNDGYIRTGTRNQTNGVTKRDNTSRGGTNVREGRNTTPTYNKPNRVDTSTERTRNTNTGSSTRESNRGSGSNNSSGNTSTTRSSSGSNNSSSSSGGGERRR